MNTGISWGKIGSLKLAQGDFSNASFELERALAIFKLHQAFNFQAYVLKDMGDLEVEKKNYNKAAVHYREALVLFEQHTNKHGQATVMSSLGKLALLQNDKKEAQYRFKTAYSIFNVLKSEKDKNILLPLINGPELRHEN